MNRFADLLSRIDESREADQIVAALIRYFLEAPRPDSAWAVKLLLGEGPKRMVSAERLKMVVIQQFDVPEWLFTECLKVSGDLCETISLSIPELGEAHTEPPTLSDCIESRILTLAKLNSESQIASVLDSWSMLLSPARLAFSRLVAGTFRSPVSAEMVVRAIACAFNLPVAAVWHRLTGTWAPTEGFFEALTSQDISDTDISRPFPLCGVEIKRSDFQSIGDLSAWQAEWKWDGIRAQLVRRGGRCFLWSKSEALITDRFPEIVEASQGLPDGTVLDGEIVAWSGGMPVGRSPVLARMERKAGTKPNAHQPLIAFVAFDVLESRHEDMRGKPFLVRRDALEALLAECVPSLLVDGFEHPGIQPLCSNLPLSARVSANGWEELSSRRHEARSLGVEGIVLKRLDSTYHPEPDGHRWLVWETEALSIKAVLMYAERGSGSKATEFVNYTLGVWIGSELVPIAKVACALPAEEIEVIDEFIASNTLEKFGPVRTVKPGIVMELHFEGVDTAARRKAGLVLRSPRISRLLSEHKPEAADSLEAIQLSDAQAWNDG